MGLIEQTNASTKPRSISHYRPRGYHGYSSSLSGEDAVVAGIIGGVAGGVLLVGFIVFLVVYYCYCQKKARHDGPVQVVRPPEAGVHGMNNTNSISDGAAGVPPSTQHQAIQPLGVPNANPFAPGYCENNNNNMGRNDYAPAVGVPMQAQMDGYGSGVYYVRNENCDEVRAFSRVSSTLSQKSTSSAGSNDYDYGSNYRR